MWSLRLGSVRVPDTYGGASRAPVRARPAKSASSLHQGDRSKSEQRWQRRLFESYAAPEILKRCCSQKVVVVRRIRVQVAPPPFVSCLLWLFPRLVVGFKPSSFPSRLGWQRWVTEQNCWVTLGLLDPAPIRRFICSILRLFPSDQPARGQSVSLSQVEVIPLTLELMPSWRRWLFGALSIEIHSSLR